MSNLQFRDLLLGVVPTYQAWWASLVGSRVKYAEHSSTIPCLAFLLSHGMEKPRAGYQVISQCGLRKCTAILGNVLGVSCLRDFGPMYSSTSCLKTPKHVATQHEQRRWCRHFLSN